MDLKRIASSLIVALTVAIMLLIPNNYVIGMLFSLIAIIAMYEYLKAISKICNPVKWISYLSCLYVVLILFIPQEYKMTSFMAYIPIVLLILFMCIIVTNMKISFKDICYTLLGICYIPIFITFLTLINNMENGKILIGIILINAWGTDIFAYLVGRHFGKHKFSKVSPKKSIEGCIGGIVGAIIIMLAYTYILNKFLSVEYTYLFSIIIAIILSIIGQIGDFAASCIKRYVDIKDYSDLIPGHGGMLDRIDSVLFIAPFAYILFILI